MEFLTEKNIYHGDLAARNVLLNDHLVAKVADFGDSISRARRRGGEFLFDIGVGEQRDR